MAAFKNETELATKISAWLRSQHWSTYHEVCGRGGSARADIVAVFRPRLWVIECKLTLGLSVLAQADHWRRYAHMVSVAVPSSGRRSQARDFAKIIAGERGIGIITIDEHGTIRDPVTPRLNRRPSLPGVLAKMLHEDQCHVVPGQRGGDYSTPFRRTCRLLSRTIRSHGKDGRMFAAVAMRVTAHHYGSDAAARSTLVSLADQGIVPGIQTVREGRRVYFLLTEGSTTDG